MIGSRAMHPPASAVWHAVRVEIAAVRGSAPREVGACMVVHEHGEMGSIGGGHLEWLAVLEARRLLAAWRAAPAEAAAVERVFTLGASLGQCCGGVVTLRYAPSTATEPPMPAPLFTLQLHGAGHVGRALVRLLSTLPCTVHWVDVRAAAFAPPDPSWSTGPARIACSEVDSPEVEVGELPAGAMVLVMTHSHALDARICEAALARGDLAYVGLIGSKTKRARFVHRWQARGLAPQAIERLVCPVGVAGIDGKQPEVIAAAVLAQLLQVASQRAAAGAADPRRPALREPLD